jgi:GTP pyrophosphokinase
MRDIPGGRQVRVSWADTIVDTFRAGLQIHCRDREGLVVDVMNSLQNYKVKVISLGARSTGDGFATVNLQLEVNDLAQLRAIITRINGISSVIDILRKDVDA